jgi:hypothetical protein
MDSAYNLGLQNCQNGRYTAQMLYRHRNLNVFMITLQPQMIDKIIIEVLFLQ